MSSHSIPPRYFITGARMASAAAIIIMLDAPATDFPSANLLSITEAPTSSPRSMLTAAVLAISSGRPIEESNLIDKAIIPSAAAKIISPADAFTTLDGLFILDIMLAAFAIASISSPAAIAVGNNRSGSSLAKDLTDSTTKNNAAAIIISPEDALTTLAGCFILDITPATVTITSINAPVAIAAGTSLSGSNFANDLIAKTTSPKAAANNIKPEDALTTFAEFMFLAFPSAIEIPKSAPIRTVIAPVAAAISAGDIPLSILTAKVNTSTAAAIFINALVSNVLVMLCVT